MRICFNPNEGSGILLGSLTREKLEMVFFRYTCDEYKAYVSIDSDFILVCVLFLKSFVLAYSNG